MYLQITFILFLSDLEYVNSGKTIFTYFRLSKCSNHETVVSQMYNIKSYLKDSWGYCDLNVNITKDFPSQLQLTIAIQKCANLEAPDSCLQFLKPTLSNFCRLWSMENQIWTPIVECITPVLGCPMKKGLYTLRNCTVDIDAVKFVPSGHGNFKITIEIKNVGNPERLICFNFDMSGSKK